MFSRHKVILIVIIIVSLILHLWGLKKDLPLTEEFDEALFVVRAANIAATGDLNPHWFGNPGSTVIYPLAFVYRTTDIFFYGGSLTGESAGLKQRFENDSSDFYFQGRLLSIIYSIGALLLLYLIGRRLFSEQIALIATWLTGIYPIVIAHAQMVRTDSAATFFGLLTIWQLLRLYETPNRKNRLLTGIAFGLAVATKYYMASLVIPIVIVEILSRKKILEAVRNSLFLLLVAISAFLVVTPHFFTEFSTTFRDISFEGRSGNLGADGFSSIGNLVWYLYSAIPASITWPQVIFLVLDFVLMVWQFQPQYAIVFSFLPAFLIGISASALHWQRWIIQILPLIALLTASGIYFLAFHLKQRVALFIYKATLCLFIIIISAWPLYKTIQYLNTQTKPSTRIQAWQWLQENLSSDSRLTYEFYTYPAVPPASTAKEGKFKFAAAFSLASVGKDGIELTALSGAPRNSFLTFVPMPRNFKVGENKTVSEYASDGHDYLLINDNLRQQYLKEREHYPAQAAFYQELDQKVVLIKEFKPYNCPVFEFFAGCHGPGIKVYKLQN